MATLTLHPIQHGFQNDYGLGMETVVLSPEHLRGLLIHEYRFIRNGGASRKHARWHVWRMIAMIWDGNNSWLACRMPEDAEEFEYAQEYDEAAEWEGDET